MWVELVISEAGFGRPTLFEKTEICSFSEGLYFIQNTRFTNAPFLCTSDDVEEERQLLWPLHDHQPALSPSFCVHGRVGWRLCARVKTSIQPVRIV
jgi:hypothetical protein